jgi:hypothetical protein
VLTRLEHELLDPQGLDLEHVRNLAVRQRPDLREQQRCAMLGVHRAQVRQQRSQVLTVLDLGGNVIGPRNVVCDLDRSTVSALKRHASVAGDRVEPGSRRMDLVARARPTLGRLEHVLHDILSVLAVADHVAGERLEAMPVTGEQFAQGRWLSISGQLEQLVVGDQAQRSSRQRRAPPARRAGLG